MKKFLMFLMASVLLLGACTDKKEKQNVDTNVEKTVSSDILFIQENYGDNFVWYESDITLYNFLDDEDCDGTVMSVTNIFQTFIADSIGSESPLVVMIKHNGELMDVKEIYGYWSEDLPLNASDIEYTFTQAYEQLMKADIIKPHSVFCVLRKPLGPCPCNPQYIFGNANSTLIFVDATTSDVSDTNPAFNTSE